MVIPYLSGVTTDQRSDANTEIARRPLSQRRKGPGGVGARIPPPPHQATLDRRVEGGSTETYLELFDRVLDGPDRDHAEALNRYLRNDVLDWQLRQGRPDGERLELVSALDAAIQARRLREEVTAFGALDPRVVKRLRADDIVSDDSYLVVSLDPAVAARYGTPVALTLPAGLPAAALDRDTQRLMLARRHSWLLLALGAVLVAVLL